MVQSLVMGILSAVIVLVLPAFMLPERPAEQPVNYEILVIHSTDRPADEKQTIVRVDIGSEILEMDLEEYLSGVVLAEMPASFELEAMKAQAVAARTFTLRKLENSKHTDCDLCCDSNCCQAWISEAYLQEKMGSAWSEYLEKARMAVLETEGQVMTYERELIEAVYFSCSGGMTEDAAAVWGSTVPYLRPVVSPGEEVAARYQSQVRVPYAEFQRVLKDVNPSVSFEGKKPTWFGEVVYSAGNGVYTMEIGGQVFPGTTLRSLFQLNSTQFTVSLDKDDVIFEVLGFGHRVGMSQYGANAMAKNGSDYKEILRYYYSGIELEIR